MSQVATNVGLSWGGKQPLLRDSTVLPGTLGEFSVPAKMYYVPGKGIGEWEGGHKWVTKRCAGARQKDMSLKPGQPITNVFGADDPPRWYDLEAPRVARARTDDQNVKETRRRKKAREKFLEKNKEMTR